MWVTGRIKVQRNIKNVKKTCQLGLEKSAVIYKSIWNSYMEWDQVSGEGSVRLLLKNWKFKNCIFCRIKRCSSDSFLFFSYYLFCFPILSYLCHIGVTTNLLDILPKIQLALRCGCAEGNAGMDTQNTKIVMDATGVDASQSPVGFLWIVCCSFRNKSWMCIDI